MIEDQELRALFKAESDEHLQTLESGLLRLEANPADVAVIEDLFRCAHSLKGAARMLGLAKLESLAHHFEDELGAARRGNRPISAEGATQLYHGLDTMSKLAMEAYSGDNAQVDLPKVLALLRGERCEERPLNVTINQTSSDEPDPVHTNEATSRKSKEDNPETLANTFKIETIRVEPQKLDALMTLAGEMVVTTARVARALSAVEELVELWEEWHRDATRSNVAVLPSGQPRRSTQIQDREAERLKRLQGIANRLEKTSDEEIGRLGLVADNLIEAIQDIRLLPFSTIFNLFSRMVRDLSTEQGKEVRLEFEGGNLTADKHLLEELKDPLMHMIRNAVDHAFELPEEREILGKAREATIRLRAYRTSNRMVVEIEDDGSGLDETAIRKAALHNRLFSKTELEELSQEQIQNLIFLPGFSTNALITDVSGRGVGLDVVHTNIDRLKATISVHSEIGIGCTFRIEAPLTLATTRVLLVRVAQRSYAFPIDAVQETFIVSPSAIFSLEGQTFLQSAAGPFRVASLTDLLELRSDGTANEKSKDEARSGVLLAIGHDRLGVFVDALVDEQEVILKPFGGLLQRVRNLLGSTILSTGEICMVLNPRDLVKTRQPQQTTDQVSKLTELVTRKVILLAEDSITTRTQEKRILESAGYEVVTAVDGADAFTKLSTRAFDAVVTDIEMPNMTGLQLTERIRMDSKYKELPIILVTSLASNEDKKRGVEIGASAYITKGNFEQKLLLETLRRLV